MKSLYSRLALIAMVSVLGACAHQRVASDSAPVYSANRASSNQAEWGVVRSIDSIQSHEQLSGAGAVAGGVAGAVVGRQFGGGRDGRTTGTFLGALAGIFIGNEIEKQNRGLRGGVRVSVQLDGGGHRSFEYADAGGLRIGDRVRVEGNQLIRM